MNSSKPPIYLFSKTPYDDSIEYVPIIETTFYDVDIDFSKYDLIVATSKQIFGALDSIDSSWKTLGVIAISEPTAAEAVKHGADVIDMVHGYGTELREKITENYADKKILYPRAKIIATDFADNLREENIAIEDVVIYETSCNKKLKSFELAQHAVLIFTSPSSVACFEQQFTFNEQHIIVSIGTTTQKALPRNIKIYIPEVPTIKASVQLAKTLQK